MLDKITAITAYVLIGVGVLLAIMLIIALITVPFAFLGSILLLVASMFTAIDITYLSSFVVGLLMYVFGYLMSI